MPPPHTTAHAPFRDGFAALGHEPALLPAELTWRWCFGLSAIALVLISFALFLRTLTISQLDQLLLRTLYPALMGDAVRHIFHGSLVRLALQQSALLLSLTLLWAFASTAGRSAILRRLVAMFSREDEEDTQPLRWEFGTIFTLQLLRALWSMIAAAVALALLIYGVVMVQNDHAVRAAFALSFGVGVAVAAGILLNWYFGLAPLLCVRSGAGAMEAMEQAVQFSAQYAARLFLLAIGFFLLRLVWAGGMFLVFLSPLRAATSIGPLWVSAIMAAIALIYCAGADALKLAKLGAYASLAEGDAAVTPEPEQVPELVPQLGLA